MARPPAIRANSLPTLPVFKTSHPLPDAAQAPLARNDFQPRNAANPSGLQQQLLALALASGLSEERAALFQPATALKELRAYKGELEALGRQRLSAFVTLNANADENRNERFLKHIVALENLRHPGLNLGISRGTAEFAAHIAERRGQAPLVAVERTAVMHLVNEFHHVILYEASYNHGKTYLRSFDPLPFAIAHKYAVGMCNDLRKVATAELPVKLDAQALRQQFSEESCDIFAVTFAVESLKQHDGNETGFVAPPFTEGRKFEAKFHDRSDAEGLHADFLKHAQSGSMLKKILKRKPELGEQPLEGDHRKLAKRHADLQVDRHVAYQGTGHAGSYAVRTVPTSIIEQRLAYLSGIEAQLEAAQSGSSASAASLAPAVSSSVPALKDSDPLRRKSLSHPGTKPW
ncbi:MAG: hypothetical protein ACRYGK_11110 [Janthinobacterium lividum]